MTAPSARGECSAAAPATAAPFMVLVAAVTMAMILTPLRPFAAVIGAAALRPMAMIPAPILGVLIALSLGKVVRLRVIVLLRAVALTPLPISVPGISPTLALPVP